VAYRLLLQSSAPSWLAMIESGATTIWENWEPATAEHPGSLNHYSKGAVATYLHRYVAGIRPVAGEPAYRRFEVRPVPGGGITWAEAELDTPYGRIRTRWDHDGDGFRLEVAVPSGTRASVVLSEGEVAEVLPGEHRFSGRVPSPT